jgi:U3 small nucleolar RNA-associated protein 22
MYSDTLKFFFDIYGGHRIGAIWLPSVSGARPFRTLGGFSSMPTPKVRSSSICVHTCDLQGLQEEKKKGKEKGTVVLNQQSVLDEIERLGTGFIKKIILRGQS